MNKKEFNSFICELDELIKSLKPNEKIAIDIYNCQTGELISDNEIAEVGFYTIID